MARIRTTVALGALLALAGLGLRPSAVEARTVLVTSPEPVTRCPIPILVPPTEVPGLAGRLDRRLAVLRARAGIPGISAALILPDGTTWTGTDGLADVAAGRPVTPDTAFAVGSISKTFTTALILDLRDEGRLSLDDAATRYLPGVTLDPRVTIRQLLDHTSGVFDYFFDPRIDRALQSDRAAVWTAARALTYVDKPYFAPGRGWHYSNTNFLLLGMIAERVGGAPLASQLTERFLGPLALDRTYDQVAGTPAGPTAHSYRVGAAGTAPVDLSDGASPMIPFRSVITAADGAGSMASTALDLVRWATVLYDGHVLSAASLTEMIADVDRPTARGYRPYGLGLEVVSVAGHPALGHAGRLLGAAAEMRWIPDLRVAVAVVSNQSRVAVLPIAASLVALATTPVSRCMIGPAPAVLTPRDPFWGPPDPGDGVGPRR